MTQAKFIALLNQYLDHHLEPEEAALLEAEISRNPARRAIYLQYCRMHKGCLQLADAFREQAPAPRISARHLQQHRPVRPSWRLAGWVAGLGGVAAAAGLAVVMVTRTPETDAPMMARTATPPAAATAAHPVLKLPEPAVATHALRTVFNPAEAAVAALPESVDPVPFTSEQFARFDWMHNVQMTPVQWEDYSFEVRPAAVDERQRTYRSHKPFQGKVEMTAFQFQR
jgi:hypothetical protein